MTFHTDYSNALNDPETPTLNRLLIRYMLDNRLTQTELAQLLKVDYTMVSRVFAQKRRFSPSKAPQIAELLQVSEEEAVLLICGYDPEIFRIRAMREIISKMTEEINKELELFRQELE